MNLDFNVLTAEEANKLTMDNLTERQKAIVRKTAKAIEDAAKEGRFSIKFEGSEDTFRLCCMVFKGYKISLGLCDVTIRW